MKEDEESKEIQRRYQEEIKRQYDIYAKQQEALRLERLEQEKRMATTVTIGKIKMEITEQVEHAQEEEVTLYVQGQPIPSSQITDELLQQMTPEEFALYERLVAEQQGE